MYLKWAYQRVDFFFSLVGDKCETFPVRKEAAPACFSSSNKSSNIRFLLRKLWWTAWLKSEKKMDNGEADRERTRRGVILRIGLLMTFLFLFFDSDVQQRQRGNLSSTTNSITSGITSNPNTNVLLSTPTPQQTAEFLDRLNKLTTVNSDTINTRDLSQIFPRNVSGLFQGVWDYRTATTIGTGTAGNGGDNNLRKFPWNAARHGGFMVRHPSP